MIEHTKTDLFNIMEKPELRTEIFSYLDKYTDNSFRFREVSRCFFYLSAYDKIVISKQSSKSLQNLFRINKIRTLSFRMYNKKLFQLSPELMSHVQKIKMNPLLMNHTFTQKQFHFFCKHFQNISVTNLNISDYTDRLSELVLRFNKLKTLHITISSKENENIVFELLKTNKNTLTKLNIGIFTGKNIDEHQVVQIIEDHLSLEKIEIRKDLFSYKMIKANTKYIKTCIVFEPFFIHKLKYIVSLCMHNIQNEQLPFILNTLEMVQFISLQGVSSNIDTSIEHPSRYAKILYTHSDHPYDGSVADNIIIRSTRLQRISLSSFTINRLSSTPSVYYISIEDVHFLSPVYFSDVKELYVHNNEMNPNHFHLEYLKFPRLKHLSLLRCFINQLFVFNPLKSLQIQTCIIDIDLLIIIKRHKKLRNFMFYNNDWCMNNKKHIQDYLHKIEVDHNPDEW